MKGLRTTLVSMIVVGLLAGPAVGAARAATDVMTEPAVIVSGTQRLITEGDAVLEPTLDGVDERTREQVEVYVWEMDDARLGGRVTLTSDVDRWLDEAGDDYGIFWGTVSVENEDGSWQGTFVHSDGQTDAYDGELGRFVQLQGSGAYEGWSAILYEYGPNPDASSFDARPLLNGMMFPGDLPPDRQ